MILVSEGQRSLLKLLALQVLAISVLQQYGIHTVHESKMFTSPLEKQTFSSNEKGLRRSLQRKNVLNKQSKKSDRQKCLIGKKTLFGL